MSEEILQNKSEQQPEKATIKLSDFNYEILEKIIRAYDRIIGGRGSSYLSPSNLEEIRVSLEKRQPVEYRYGSRLSVNSKLWIQCVPFTDEIKFFFDPNIPTGDKEIDRLAEELETEFDTEVANILKVISGI